MKKCFLIVITLLLSVMLSSCAGGIYPEGDYVDANGNYYTFSNPGKGLDRSIFYTENGTQLKTGQFRLGENNEIIVTWDDKTSVTIGTYVQKTKSINVDGKIVYQHHGL